MTLLYLILTHPGNRTTRQRWQIETWLKDVDYVYLEDGEEGYLNVAKKYVAWLRENELKHDWYFFCDDDTWVFDGRLRKYLVRPSNKYIMSGFKGGEFIVEGTSLFTTWASGGAGIVISKPLLLCMQEYVKGEPIISNESDTSLAIWAKLSCPDFVFANSPLFRPQHPNHESNKHIKDAVTYHYCSQNDFYELNEKR